MYENINELGLAKLMHPTRDSRGLLLGVDVTGLYLILTWHGKEQNSKRVIWHIEKFPLKFYVMLEAFQNGTRNEGVWPYNDVTVEIERVNDSTSGIIGLNSTSLESTKLSIKLERNEIEMLKNFIRQYFCM